MIIYETINLVNGKKYIGQDSHNDPNYLGGGIYLKFAIKKYGKGNFKKEILEFCIDKNHLNKREEWWLQSVDAANNPLYYNRTNKPCGAVHTSESKLAIKTKLKNKPKPEGFGQRRSEKVKGISKPEGFGDKIRGRKRSEEQKQKMRKPKSVVSKLKGIKRSEEFRQKISKSLIGRRNTWSNGIKNKKEIIQYDLQMNEIKKWSSIKEAAGCIKIDPAGISNVCLGKQKTAGGFIWKNK